MNFKEVTPTDCRLITDITLQSDRKNCDLSFANLCSWQFLYHTEFAIYQDFLAVRFLHRENPAYLCPVGKGDIRPVISQLVEDALSRGAEFKMLGVCPEVMQMLEAHFPGCFDFQADRDLSDYIYLRTDLAELKGKKFQQKRNHINRFKKEYPHHEVMPITAADVDDCLQLETQWYRENREADPAGMRNERQALTHSLKNFEQMGMQGLILRVNGTPAAFTLGCPISRTTFDIQVEKADVNINGAYAMINQSMAATVPQSFTYINREEDLGIPGLRKAKLSYNPTIILTKHTATLKGEEQMQQVLSHYSPTTT